MRHFVVGGVFGVVGPKEVGLGLDPIKSDYCFGI